MAGIDLHSKSDSAIPGYLYQKYGDTNELWNSLDGIFACVIWDERNGYFCAARDPMGICPLYWGKGEDGSMWFSSELKAIQTACVHFDCFPPVSPAAQTCRLPCCGLGLRRAGLATARQSAQTWQTPPHACAPKHGNICGWQHGRARIALLGSTLSIIETGPRGPRWTGAELAPQDLPRLVPLSEAAQTCFV